MDTDPSKRQYFVFALMVSLIGSFALNFFIPAIVEASSALGYPLSTEGASGLGRFFIQFVNSVSMGAILSVPVYYLIKKLQGM